jgi:hypothetical protein
MMHTVRLYCISEAEAVLTLEREYILLGRSS